MTSGPFGIMFHSFHGNMHPQMVGSIDGQQLSDLLRHADKNYRLMDAADWAKKAAVDALEDKDICLTFDDGLTNQFDVALPVLQKFGRTAFWFCPGAPLEGRAIESDIHKYFIATCFKSFDDFFDAFVVEARNTSWSNAIDDVLRNPEAQDYLKEWTFYTKADRLYRYIRDIEPGQDCCREVLNALMLGQGVDTDELMERLWLKADNLRQLEAAGHVVGLHSYSHPMRLDLLSPELQREEYARNHLVLSNILTQPPKAMSHPCNAFTRDTFNILRGQGIELGFRADMNQPLTRHLDFRRIDHIYYLDGQLT